MRKDRRDTMVPAARRGFCDTELQCGPETGVVVGEREQTESDRRRTDAGEQAPLVADLRQPGAEIRW